MAHLNVKPDPAYLKYAAMMKTRHHYFRWTPRTARLTFIYVAVVPTIMGYIAYSTDENLPRHHPSSQLVLLLSSYAQNCYLDLLDEFLGLHVDPKPAPFARLKRAPLSHPKVEVILRK
ncbi:nadh:ubiquinone oxidoreductase subunit [Fusarium acutatum]|uniref:Nadh:ubiquinone oxidoreductase subunit n=1 Tax=Fusarium acutatum TaxID=78861 RepID=A0A8H4JW36_9HYPO|nr:nadh:ubiquinone oxidoreductase subunit [Fusarium acutatum]